MSTPVDSFFRFCCQSVASLEREPVDQPEIASHIQSLCSRSNPGLLLLPAGSERLFEVPGLEWETGAAFPRQFTA